MILLSGFYREADASRRAEFQECLRRNIENNSLDEIHVFIEEPVEQSELLRENLLLAGAKVRLIAHGRRVTYRDFFAYANSRLSGRRVIVANADIYFDHTLARLDGYELAGKLLCLSRWDVWSDGSIHLFDHPASQDAWIFQAPIREIFCDFHLGVMGCDNRLAWEAEQAGLALSNPSRSVRAYHLHSSQVRRHGGSRLTGPTQAIPPRFLGTPYVSCASDAFRETMTRETIFAITSLSPAQESAPVTRSCIASWRNAGLQVCAFNHPAEIAELSKLYDVEFVPVAETTESVFGRRLVPIKAMLEWAAEHDAPALLINSDIQLRMADWEVKRLRWLSDGGLCYFVRYNHNGDVARAHREPYGIDAFLFHGRDAARFPDSFLSMGQPFWDYWIPHVYLSRNLPLYRVDFPVAFHRSHQFKWSWANWHRCALEFGRITGELENQSAEACHAMCARLRWGFEHHKISVPQQPMGIQDWVQQTFSSRGPRTFLELGAHRGTDTAWMAEIPDVTIHAFEPDPRNYQAPHPNVRLHHAAIAERDGYGPLFLSLEGWGQEWTHSSSIKRPKNHLHCYPVTFGEAIDVELVALDTFSRQQGLDVIDFIWADVQGAEGEMISSGHQTLARTRYLYTAYSDDEMYEDQSPLREILKSLPDFRVLELWPENALLENQKLKA